MNFKKLIPLIFIFSFILLFSQVYASGECNVYTGPAGAFIADNGDTCVCEETTSTDINGTVSIAYMATCSISTTCNAQTGPAGVTWVNPDGYNCICNQTTSTDPNGTVSIAYMATCSPPPVVVEQIRCNAGTVGKVIETNGQKCVCVQVKVESNGTTTNPDNKYILQCSTTGTTSGGGSVPPKPSVGTTVSADPNGVNTVCRDEIKALNSQIQELSKPDMSYVKERLNNIRVARQKIDNLFQEYKECRWNKLENQSSSSSPITGRITLVSNYIGPASSSSVATTSADSIGSVTMQTAISTDKLNVAQEVIPLENIETIETENTNYAVSIQARIDNELNNDTNLSDACKEKLKLIKEQMNIIQQNITELKKFRDDNKDLLTQIKELVKQRNEKLKTCFGVKEGNFDCKVPEDLILRLKELDTQKSKLQETMIANSITVSAGTINNDEYTKLKEEYLAITQKIQAIKNDCAIRQTTTQVQNICPEKNDILANMDGLKKKLELTTNEQEIYDIKTKLEYLNSKYSNLVCAQPTTGEKPIATAQGNVDIDACVNSLVEKAGIEADVAKYACQKKFNQEDQGYKDRLVELEAKIQAQQQIIDNLKSKIADIQERINSLTSDEKIKFIQDNATSIKEDTLAKIDKKIESLKKLIENIDNSEMNSEKKTEMVDSINSRIAALEMLKTNITNAETTDELKNYIKEAREADSLANKEFIISGLTQQSTELEKIINTYLADTKDYESLKVELDALNTKITGITDQSTNQEINSIKEQYRALKEKVKVLAKEVESK